MDKQQPDPLSVTFAALADPTRRAILARLASGEASVKELGGPVRSQSAGDLEAPPGARARRAHRAGAGRRSGGPGGCKAGPLRDVADWVGQYRPHWEESFERLDAFLPGFP